ncbi:MAG: metallophosphoesterase family protein [Bacteroidota bacterium]|nr:metallophosphoesterase family protein [Bacteroidota bacterium]
MIKKLMIGSFVFLSLQFNKAQETQKKIEQIIREWAAPNEFPDHVILSATEDPSSSIGVNWRTHSNNTVGYLEIAPSGPGPDFVYNAKTFPAVRTHVNSSEASKDGFESSFFEVQIKGLTPNTLYAYRVGNDDFKSEWHQFTTASDKPTPLSFLYVGDAQNYILELWSRVIRNAYKKAPNADFFIHAGDLVNDAHDESEWNEWFSAGGFIHSEIPAIAVPGNHEYRGLKANKPRENRELSVQWNAQFGFPKNGPEELHKTCYYVDYPNLRVVALNSNREIALQAQWLRKVLDENDKKWTIVTFHHPIFSASTGRDNPKLRALWKPLLDHYNVDLALQGHDHSYARGAVYEKPTYIEKNPANKIVKGPVYVVSVSGGKMYSVKESGWGEFGATQDKNGERKQLFQHISIDGNRLIYQSFTATGELFDRFELLKQNGKNQYKD